MQIHGVGPLASTPAAMTSTTWSLSIREPTCASRSKRSMLLAS
jgi:hypothetical protein